jgi:uncharacterized protein
MNVKSRQSVIAKRFIGMKKNKDFEADYFLKENEASKHRQHEENLKQEKIAADEQNKALHYMKCPRCGHDLLKKRMTQIEVEQCSSCGVLVLKPEDIDNFVADEKSILKSLIDFFKA